MFAKVTEATNYLFHWPPAEEGKNLGQNVQIIGCHFQTSKIKHLMTGPGERKQLILFPENLNI